MRDPKTVRRLARHLGRSVAALSAGVSVACAAAPAVRPGASETAPLTACDIAGVQGAALCGTVEVREDRTEQAGRKIALNVVVLKATGPTPERDPLFTFAGGPGQGEASDAAQNAKRFARIRTRRDIVMIDQRGTGGSNPLNCNLGDPAQLVDAFVAGVLPVSGVEKCRRELEVRADLRLYTTAVAVEDAEEVRRRLGYREINLYGGSYGSRVALAFLGRYPQHVRTATLRSVFPTTLRNPLNTARDGQRALDRIFSDCAADPACRSAYPDLPADMAAVLSDLARRPAQLVVPTRSGDARIAVTRDVFAGMVRRMLYDARSQAAVPMTIAKARTGDFKPLAPALAQTFGIERGLSTGMFLSVTCSEDVSRIADRDVGRATAGTFVGAAPVRGLLNACVGWPRSLPPSSFYRPVSSRAPVLLFSGSIDPMTPPAYGAQVARTLPNSRHFVMSGVAHGPFPECAIDMMAAFVEAGSTARLDGGCLADIKRPPFTVAAR